MTKNHLGFSHTLEFQLKYSGFLWKFLVHIFGLGSGSTWQATLLLRKQKFIPFRFMRRRNGSESDWTFFSLIARGTETAHRYLRVVSIIFMTKEVKNGGGVVYCRTIDQYLYASCVFPLTKGHPFQEKQFVFIDPIPAALWTL